MCHVSHDTRPPLFNQHPSILAVARTRCAIGCIECFRYAVAVMCPSVWPSQLWQGVCNIHYCQTYTRCRSCAGPIGCTGSTSGVFGLHVGPGGDMRRTQLLGTGCTHGALQCNADSLGSHPPLNLAALLRTAPLFALYAVLLLAVNMTPSVGAPEGRHAPNVSSKLCKAVWLSGLVILLNISELITLLCWSWSCSCTRQQCAACRTLSS